MQKFFTPSSAEVVSDDYDYIIHSDTKVMLASQKYSYDRWLLLVGSAPSVQPFPTPTQILFVLDERAGLVQN